MSERPQNGTPKADARILPLARGLLLFAPISLLCNEVGSLLRYPEIGAAVLFLPYAALTAALVVAPRRHWLWYILVDAVTHFAAHRPQWSLSWVLLASVANTARALTAAVTLRWVFGGAPRLDSVRALMLFVANAVLLAPAVGATLGAAIVVLLGGSSTYWAPWNAWFISNALTGLTILPAFLHVLTSAVSRRRPPITRRRVAEGLLLTGTLIATCALAFFVPSDPRWPPVLPLYLPLPILIWAALRFGSGGASLALTAVAVAAITGVDDGSALLAPASRDHDVLALQIFVLLTTIPVLCIAVVASARHDAVQLYRVLLGSLQDHVAILDARGIVLEVNESWQGCAGSGDADASCRVLTGGDYLAACRSAAEAGDAAAGRALTGVAAVLSRHQRRFEMEYGYGHDGQRRVYAMSVEALERSDGGAVVMRADVTARHQAQMEVEEQRRELSHLARVSVLGELSGALAHELNQPLAAILANAEAARRLLQRRPADLEEIGAILRDIISDDQRAAQVIQRLSAMLRRGETHRQPMDMRELVNEVLELCHAELIARHVAVTAVVEPNPPRVLGDRVQLQQVLLNLILNACDAMSSTPAPDRRLFLSVATDARHSVHLSVRDCGTGIPPALIDRLFEPFVTTKSQGLGLGLSISRSIVAAHGGRLWAENNADRGATLHCVLASTPAVASPAPHGASLALTPSITDP